MYSVGIDILKVMANNEALSSENESLKAQLVECRKIINGLRSELLLTRGATSFVPNGVNRDNGVMLKEENLKLNADNIRLNAENKKIAQEYDRAMHINAQLKTQLEGYKKQVQELTDIHSFMNDATEVDKLRKENEQLVALVKQLGEQVNGGGTNNKLASKDKELASKDKEIAELTDRLNALKGDYILLRDKCSGLESDNTQLMHTLQMYECGNMNKVRGNSKAAKVRKSK